MRNFVLAALLTTSLVPAQVATNDDGSVVLIGSTWQLQGVPGKPGQSVFRFHQNRWERIAAAEDMSDASSPILTGDGTIAGWERATRCSGSCMLAVPRSQAEFQGLSAEVHVSLYQARLSHNGRYLLSPGFYGFLSPAIQDLQMNKVWNAETGLPLGQVLASRPADDGTLLLRLSPSGRLATWRPGESAKELLPGVDAVEAFVSADGSRAAIRTESRLLLIDLRTGAQTGSIETNSGSRAVAISNDGGRVIFAPVDDTSHLSIWDTASPEPRRLSVPEEPFWYTALSGDGTMAYVLTTGGTLLRILLNEGRTETVLEQLPLRLQQISFAAVPGSAVVYDTAPPSGTGLEADAGGTKLPVVGSDDGFAIQIPWEMTAPVEGLNLPLTIRRAGNPFEYQSRLFVSAERTSLAFAPYRYSSDRRFYIKAAKGPFDSLVEPATPAMPGETIHVYLTGLGPLDRDVPTGTPGPSNPPARPLAPIACYMRGEEFVPALRGLVLPFVAYAPGLIGVYQVDMTIPEDWPSGESLVICESDMGFPAAGWIPIRRP